MADSDFIDAFIHANGLPAKRPSLADFVESTLNRRLERWQHDLVKYAETACAENRDLTIVSQPARRFGKSWNFAQLLKSAHRYLGTGSGKPASRGWRRHVRNMKAARR